MYEETFYQLKLLSEALKNNYLKNIKEIIIKPHHACPIDKIISSLEIENCVKIKINPINDYNPKNTICFLANSTSAIFDVIFCKFRYMITGSGQMLNLNPLYNLVKIRYINSSDEFYNQLHKLDTLELYYNNDLFYFNASLQNWKKFLFLH